MGGGSATTLGLTAVNPIYGAQKLGLDKSGVFAKPKEPPPPDGFAARQAYGDELQAALEAGELTKDELKQYQEKFNKMQGGSIEAENFFQLARTDLGNAVKTKRENIESYKQTLRALAETPGAKQTNNAEYLTQAGAKPILPGASGSSSLTGLDTPSILGVAATTGQGASKKGSILGGK